MLPDITNLNGLDIGCGEGYNTRIAARKGTKLTALDISEVFITSVNESEKQEPLGIKYQVASAIDLPFSDEYFNFAIATMSLMDISDTEKALSEAFRVIKLKGFFQFSIIHPCFTISNLGWVTNDEGKRTGFIVSDYFKKSDGEIEEWIFGAAPKDLIDKMRKFKIPWFTRILSDWLNLLIAKGFALEEFCEPYADYEILRKNPKEYDSPIIPYFLIIRCRKPNK